MPSTRTIEETAIFSALAAEQFRLFTSEILDLDNAPFHQRLDDYLSNYTYQKLCVAMPRGFGKSTHLSIAYPLWEIAKNHDVRILLVSNTAETSKSFMSEIIGHIERNPKYQLWAKLIDPKRVGVAPRMRKRKKQEEHWSMNSIVIERDGLKLKDPTIDSIGLMGPVLSKRADIIIVDDLVNQENALTEEQRSKIKDWVYTTLLPVLVPGGRFICLGNTWHADDLMSHLLKDPQFQVKERMGAIIHEATRLDLWDSWANIHLDESLTPEDKEAMATAFLAEHKTDMDTGIEVLWPERFSYADLYLKRIANPYSFARMYQCDPSIRPNQKFLEKDIERALAKGKDLVLQDTPRTEYDAAGTTSGLDLAISQKDSSDDTVLLSLDRVQYGAGDIRTGDFVIRNIERGKPSPGETRQMLIRHDALVKPRGIRVESNGYQEALIRDMGEQYILPIRAYHTGGEKNDPDIGVHSLAIMFSQGKIVLPFGNDARTRQFITKLVNELRAYPEGHTGDSLMAFWFAYSEARDAFAHRVLVATGPVTPPLPYPPNEDAADQALIAEQEVARSGYNPAVALLAQAKEADRRFREAEKNEERDLFQKMMRNRRFGY